VNDTGALVATRKPVDAAFVAVTLQVPAAVMLNDVPVTEHPAPVTA
jgi:hypothetical protein